MIRIKTLSAFHLIALLTLAALPIPSHAAPTTKPAGPAIAQADSGIVTLLANSAALTGAAKMEKLASVECILHWRDATDSATWNVEITHPGSFEVVVTYACAPDSAGGEFSVDVGKNKVAAKTASTGGWDSQNSTIVGVMKIDEPGTIPVTLHAGKKTGEGLLALRGIALRPATVEEVDRRSKSAATATVLPNGDPLTITVDFSEAPELEDWIRDARLYCAKSYPAIADAIKTDGFVPPREFNLRFSREYQGVAATSNTHIFMAVKYVKGNPTDIGMVGHELVHVIQHYKQYRPGWLVEGIADYVRYYVLEPGSRRGRFDARNADYKRGYQPTAGLLAYITKFYDKEIVRKMNSALRDGSYKDSMFVHLTGETADELWEDCKAVMLAK